MLLLPRRQLTRALFIFSLFLLTGSYTVLAQQVQIRGQLTDSATQEPLGDASVVLYKESSIVVVRIKSGKSGSFEIRSITPGSYTLNITYLGYRPVNRNIAATATDTIIELGRIGLQKEGLTLEAVEIVKIRPPMAIRHDTLEFNAGRFRTREKALLLELLKKLPGIQTGKDGSIRVNGEVVNRILVDGKPYFGNNPQLILRNLQAEMIDKVQYIDNKDRYPPTFNIEDGRDERVINITIKEDQKNKYSGRVAAGSGIGDHYAANASLERFSDHEQLSLLASMNNVNNASFIDGNAQDMGTGGAGISHNLNGGINYNRDLGKDLALSGSYLLTDNRSQNDQRRFRTNLLPDTTNYYDQNDDIASKGTEHAFELRTAYRRDSVLTLTGGTNIIYSRNELHQDNRYESLDELHQRVNFGQLINTRHITYSKGTAFLAFEKRSRKNRRSVSANINIGSATDDQRAFNQSFHSTVRQNTDIETDTINQRNDINSTQRTLAFSVVYTEPLARDMTLQFSYTFSNSLSVLRKHSVSYNYLKNMYDIPNDSLSNSFESTLSTHLTGVNFRLRKKRFDYTAMLLMQFTHLYNQDLTRENEVKNNIFSLVPTLLVNYTFQGNRRLHFHYYRTTQVPDPAQLQLVPDLTNPLYVTQGNPDLKPSFANNCGIRYNASNATTFHSLAINLNYIATKNKIIYANTTDTSGRQLSWPVNVNGTYYIGANITNSFSFNDNSMIINSNTAASFTRDRLYTNNILGTNSTLSVSQGVNFSYNYKVLFEITAGASVNYNRVTYPVNSINNSTFLNHTYSMTGNLNLPLGFSIAYSADYLLNTGRAEGYNQHTILLNAFISKSVLKDRRCLIRLQAFDLLNQYQSFVRNVGNTYIEDVQNRVLERLFMLSASYFLK